METVTFSSRGLALVGSLWRCASPAVVVLAHGMGSDRLSRGRFPRLAEALAERSVSSLAFDFAGCGESANAVLTLDGLTADLRSAMEFARGAGFARLGLLGHSLGGLVCLRALDAEVEALVLTGAPTGPMQYRWSEHYRPEQLEALARTGQLTLDPAAGSQRRVVLDASLLAAFAEIEPASLLSAITRPVLLVQGDGDAEERALLEHSRRALPLLPTGSRLEVIPGAPHGFGESYGPVVALASDWFSTRLLGPSHLRIGE